MRVPQLIAQIYTLGLGWACERCGEQEHVGKPHAGRHFGKENEGFFLVCKTGTIAACLVSGCEYNTPVRGESLNAQNPWIATLPLWMKNCSPSAHQTSSSSNWKTWRRCHKTKHQPPYSKPEEEPGKWLLIAHCQWCKVAALWVSELDLFCIYYNSHRGKMLIHYRCSEHPVR